MGARLYWAAYLCVLASFLWVWGSLGLTYPVPWSDEGGFLWQAIAVMERNSLFAPELNPDRHVMWMPPGYAITTGWFFKLFGFSLHKARALSCAWLVVAVTLAAAWLRSTRLRLVHLLALGLFLQGPATLAMANMARMETMLLCWVTAGMLCLSRPRPHIGLSVLACGPLVHPNGGYFLAAAAVLWLRACLRDPEVRRPTGAEWAAFGVVTALWVAYLGYVAVHFDGFLHDMGFQFAQKQVIAGLAPRGGWEVLPGGAPTLFRLLVLVGLIAMRAYNPVRPLLVPSLAAFVMSVTTLGHTYNILLLWLDLLLVVSVVETAAGWVGATPRVRFGLVWCGAATAAAVGAFYVQAARSWSDGDPKWDAVIAGVRYAPGMLTPGAADRVPYQTEADTEAVRAWLKQAAATGRPMRVAFYPAGDALLYADLRSEHLRFMQPTFHGGLAVAQVFRRSRYIPAGLQESMDLRALWVHQVPTQFQDWQALNQRDGTEAWLGHRRDLDPATQGSVRW